jgi:hypothetical protein
MKNSIFCFQDIDNDQKSVYATNLEITNGPLLLDIGQKLLETPPSFYSMLDSIVEGHIKPEEAYKQLQPM